MLIVYCVSPVDTHKPYFIHDNQTYFIEDIASYHIHAGDYFIKNNPSGAHSNYGGNKLDYFDPELLKKGPLGTASLKLYNSRFINNFKESSIYPQGWTEYMCDLKAIEVIMSATAEIDVDLVKEIINLQGHTSEGLKIRIGYDIKTKRIKTHFAKFD